MTFEEQLKQQEKELTDFQLLKSKEWQPIQSVFDEERKALGYSTLELDAEYEARKNWFEAAYAKEEIIIHKKHKLELEDRIHKLYREQSTEQENSLMRMPIEERQKPESTASSKYERLQEFREKLDKVIASRDTHDKGLENN